MLNISTDSSGKLGDLLPPTPTVFPQTAPNRENKDKKLFTATRKLAQGTPKGNALPKRLVEDVTTSLSNHQNLLAQTKKGQKPGIEILSAFRTSAAAQSNARKVLTPSAQRSTLVSENIFKSKPKVEPQPGATSGPGLSPKNRSFRGVKASEYLKNNFFIKNAFFNANEGDARAGHNKTRPEGASVNTSSGKVGAKLGGDKPHSARTDATQFNHALRALIERNSGLGQGNKDKPVAKKADAWDNDTSEGGLDLQQAENIGHSF